MVKKKKAEQKGKKEKTKKSKAEKFMEYVDEKTHTILSKRIPLPKYLSKQIVDEKTTTLALNEMKRFKEEHNRVPTKQELDKIAEIVYKQIKEKAQKKEHQALKRRRKEKSFLEKRRKRRLPYRGRREKFEEKPKNLSRAEQRRQRRLARKRGEKDKLEEKGFEPEIGKPPEPMVSKKELEDLSVTDLFSDEKKEDKLTMNEIVGDTEFGKLEKELENLGTDTQSISKEIETDKSKCPNCKTFAQDLVFCPECGEAFCSHCAKKVEHLEDHIKFTCPKCKTTFKSKKG